MSLFISRVLPHFSDERLHRLAVQVMTGVCLAGAVFFEGMTGMAAVEARDARQTTSYATSSRECRIPQSSGRVGRRKSSECETPWAFGGTGGRGPVQSIEGSSLLRNARKSDPGYAANVAPKKEEKAPQRRRRYGLETSRQEGDFRLGVESQRQTWQGQSRASQVGIEESVEMDGHHRVQAFAGVKEDNVRFSVGPEVLVREDRTRDSIATSDQPKVEAGVGMQLAIDF